ncbi:hypothetical protein PG993_011213 [Apiospora rasikravindrae]|uniref:Rhodopsin domain-containing protein n=1 Tax=Apiospora rasikravindrae TaxID=990691 RepID=A0ABR1SFV0_9PEZI
MPYDSQTAKTLDYVSATLSLVFLLTRLTLEFCRKRKFDLNFFLTSASIVAIVGRLVTTYYYLQFGAGNDILGSGSSQEVGDATYKAGQILVLVARVFFSLILWLQICLILSFYARLVHDVTVMTWVLRAIWCAVVVTFVAVVLATFLECRPFRLYWQRHPEPASCRKAYIQLVMQTSCNLLLDIVVLIIAFPLTQLPKQSWNGRLRVYVLVGLGTICIGITITRLVQTFREPDQNVRSVWASVQIAVAVFVANAPSIYGSLKLLKRARTSSGYNGSFGFADSNDTNGLPRWWGLTACLATQKQERTPRRLAPPS